MKKPLNFTKMHSLGNDFALTDSIRAPRHWTAAAIRKLANRRKGVGFDQLLCAEPPPQKTADFFMRIYNSDGSEANQCGNGVRCFYDYVRAQKLTQRRHLNVQTASRTIPVAPGSKPGSIRCDMGTPDFSWNAILQENPAQTQTHKLQTFSLSLSSISLEVHLVSFGNPHCIIRAQTASDPPRLLQQYGAAIARHPAFAAGVNIGFAFLSLEKDLLSLRTYERGAGATLACGSNVCAAAAIAHKVWGAKKNLTVRSPGGTALISCGANGSFLLESPVYKIYNGTLL